jgi:hypothetical protein
VHGEPTPLPAELPAALRTIVAKSIEKDPAERYQSMRDLVVDLKRVARRSEAAAVSVERASVRLAPLSTPRARRPAYAAIAALSVAVRSGLARLRKK